MKQKGNYITAQIRKLLNAAFNDEDLQIFCEDYFYEVANNFTAGQTKKQRISDLLDYCRRYGKTGDLLGLIQQENAVQYNQFSPYTAQSHSTSEETPPPEEPQPLQSGIKTYTLYDKIRCNRRELSQKFRAAYAKSVRQKQAFRFFVLSGKGHHEPESLITRWLLELKKDEKRIFYPHREEYARFSHFPFLHNNDDNFFNFTEEIRKALTVKQDIFSLEELLQQTHRNLKNDIVAMPFKANHSDFSVETLKAIVQKTQNELGAKLQAGAPFFLFFVYVGFAEQKTAQGGFFKKWFKKPVDPLAGFHALLETHLQQFAHEVTFFAPLRSIPMHDVKAWFSNPYYPNDIEMRAQVKKHFRKEFDKMNQSVSDKEIEQMLDDEEYELQMSFVENVLRSALSEMEEQNRQDNEIFKHENF